MKGKLHLITQDDQPMFSTRKCCEKCGLRMEEFGKNDRYYDRAVDYTKTNADKMDIVLCDLGC